MTVPLLYLPFDNSLAGRDRTGAVTASANGTPTYADGLAPGARAVVAPNTYYLSLPSTGRVTTVRGSAAIRGAITSTPAANQYALTIGNYGGGDFIGILARADATGKPRLWVRSSGAEGTANGSTAPTVGVYLTMYAEWDGTTARLRVDGAAPTSATRGAPVDSVSTGTIWLGNSNTIQYLLGNLDDVLIFDDLLTETQQDTLFDTSRAWAWDMFSRRTIHSIMRLGSPHIGPLRVGRT